MKSEKLAFSVQKLQKAIQRLQEALAQGSENVLLIDGCIQRFEFVFEQSTSRDHYEITPYSFGPKIGKKLAPPLHVDLGQGVLRVIEEIHKKRHPDLHNMNGFLVKQCCEGETE